MKHHRQYEFTEGYRGLQKATTALESYFGIFLNNFELLADKTGCGQDGVVIYYSSIPVYVSRSAFLARCPCLSIKNIQMTDR